MQQRRPRTAPYYHSAVLQIKNIRVNSKGVQNHQFSALKPAMADVYVLVSEQPLGLQKAVDAVASDSSGATATFIGT
jgi:hypothetical protein